MAVDAKVLFEPFKMGAIDVKNRIAMAPLTRNRATPGTDAPNELTVEYYRQRATAGLIVTEGAQISQQGQGYIWTPGIYTPEQVKGWSKVTDAVHREGGKIVIQLWHVGRVSHTSLQPNGAAPVAPSAVRAEAKTYIEGGFSATSEPTALTIEQIGAILQDYRQATRNAREAGFDGIEIHGANGYLIDQFLKPSTNKRTDSYGGDIEGRTHFALDVVDVMTSEWDAGHIGIRLSPVSPANGISDPDPQPVFNHLVSELSERNLAFIHVVEGATGGPRDIAPFDYDALRSRFSGAYIANNNYNRAMAIDAIASKRADMVAFGRAFIANPDLVERLRIDAPLNELHRETLYGGGAEGYTDYPTLAQTAEKV
ncbi:alkene reductase [Microvirga sp. W0021]|uniref:Alkene reductase n=1 Tax=Hohaiivirga grylli TaxID=3133970 RepID=A0ABV0BLB0_9HYPH